MRALFLSILMFISMVAVGQQVEFEKTKHNFGTIAEVDGLAYVGFKYKNVSDKPFIINSVITSCGCTTPEYRKAPLMPGEEGVIKVAFNPLGRPGYFSKDIVIYSDNRNREDRLIISGNVTPRPLTKEEEFPVDGGGGLRLSTSLISMPAIDRGQNYTQIVDLYNSSKGVIELSAKSQSPLAEVSFGSQKLAPGEATQMSYTLSLSDGAPLGHFSDSVYIIYGGKSSEKPIKVEADIVPNFSLLTREELATSPQIFLSSQFYHFSTVEQGRQLDREFTITNRGKRALRLEKIYSSSSLLSFKIKSRTIEPGATEKITLMLSTKGQMGRVSEKVTIICNDPAMPAKDIRLAASVILVEP